jgi:DUF971 family protein
MESGGKSMAAPRRYPIVKLDHEAGQLVIDWPDGHHSEYALDDLRAACPCAECNSYRDNPNLLKLAPAPSSEVRELNYVGNYAIQFVWGDEHRFGIYSWEMLRKMCPCLLCRDGIESE